MKALVPKLRRASPMILSCLGAIGVVATAVTAVRATPKAWNLCYEVWDESEEGREPTTFDYVKIGWKAYIPSVAIGAATILCIFGANGLNKRQQSAVTSAYVLLDQAYKEYRGKVKELCGKDGETDIRKAIAKDHYKGGFDVSDDKLLFYDEISERYFERTMAEVIDAEYYLNRNFILEGRVKLNDFYDLLDLPKTELGSVVGWSADSAAAFFGYQWIDFEHDLVIMDDGLECYILHIEFTPNVDF